MATPARGTKYDVTKPKPQWFKDAVETYSYAVGAEARPMAALGLYLYEKGGGKEAVKEKARQIGKVVGGVENWWNERKRQKELIGVKPTMRLGGMEAHGAVGKTLQTAALTGMALARGAQSAKAASSARGQARTAFKEGLKELEYSDTAFKYARQTKGIDEASKWWREQGNLALDRAEAKDIQMTAHLQGMSREMRTARMFNGIGIGTAVVGGVSVGMDLYRSGKAGRASAKKSTGERY